MWERDGSAIIYHGGWAGGQSYIGRVKPDGSGLVEIGLPKAWNRYGHFTVGRPGWLVTDGCYVTPGDPAKSGGAWISVLQVDWAASLMFGSRCASTAQAGARKTLIRTRSSIMPRVELLFTSDKTGQRAVYCVAVPEKLQDALRP